MNRLFSSRLHYAWIVVAVTLLCMSAALLVLRIDRSARETPSIMPPELPSVAG